MTETHPTLEAVARAICTADRGDGDQDGHGWRDYLPETRAALKARVEVLDPGLAELRRIMRNATGTEPEPNHLGVIAELWDDDHALIHFDDGIGAPYPLDMIRRLPDE